MFAPKKAGPKPRQFDQFVTKKAMDTALRS
jgi:hypothetical protein